MESQLTREKKQAPCNNLFLQPSVPSSVSLLTGVVGLGSSKGLLKYQEAPSMRTKAPISLPWDFRTLLLNLQLCRRGKSGVTLSLHQVII